MFGNVEIEAKPKKMFLLGLLAAVFAVNVIDIFVPLLLPEISQTFGISRSAAATLTAFSRLAGVATGLALSALSIKVKHKTLLAAAVLTIPLCVIGVYLSPNFLYAQIFYSLNGVGSVIVAILAPTMIAEIYPLNKKAQRISWSVAVAWIAILVGSPITGLVAGTGGVASWRDALLWFMLPATIVCFFLVMLFVPSKPVSTQLETGKAPFLNGYKLILTNKSARGCLTNSLLGSVFLGLGTYQAAFYKDVFGMSADMRGLVGSVLTASLVAGVFAAGFLVNPVGRKRLWLIGSIPAILIAITSYLLSIFIPNVWMVIGMRLVSSFLGGFVFVAGASLYVEQVPKYRGTMMSLGQALNGIGVAMGVFIGGLVLNSFVNPAIGYPMATLTLGAIGLVGALNILLFAKDPCRNENL